MILPWQGYSFPVLGRGDLYLLPALDAMALQNDGECEAEDPRTARWYFEHAAIGNLSKVRDFVASARMWQLSTGALHDLDLVKAVSQLIERGQLVGVYLEASGGAKAKASDHATVQRQLVWDIERATRGKLQNSGRTYKLTADLDLAGVPDRDRYEVVGQRDAGRILDELAHQPGTSPELAGLLAQAREKLTRDWRPPLQPNGLVLLRRVVAPRAQAADRGPAMTPSQIRKAKLGWITVELVDDEDEPWELDVDLTSTDGNKGSYNFASAGVFSRENIEPGSVKVELTYKVPETRAPDSEEAPAEEPSPAEESTSAEAAEALTSPATEAAGGLQATEALVSPEEKQFSVTVVDQLPSPDSNPISGVGISFQSGGAGETVPTDGAGAARYSAAGTDSVLAAFGEAAQLAALVKPLWTPCRGVARKNWVKANDTTTVVTPFGGRVVKVIADDATTATTRPKVTIEPFLGVQTKPGTPATFSVQPLVIMVRMLGEHFDVDKCFVLPTALTDVQDLVRLHTEYKLTDMLIVGHTDTSASDEHNLTLSLERTSAMRAYLTDDAKSWLPWYDDDKPASKRWGTTEDTHMIRSVLREHPKYPTTVLGYQQWHNAEAPKKKDYEGLNEDGKIGPLTRKQLVLDYMHHADTTVPDGTEIQVHGCGEFFPLDVTEEAIDPNAPDNKREQRNRRVEVFLFPKDVGILPPVPGETAKKGEAEYPEWRKRVVEVNFQGADSDAKYRIRLHDKNKNLMGGVACQVKILSDVYSLVSDSQGWVEFVPPPACGVPAEVRWGEDPDVPGLYRYAQTVELECNDGLDNAVAIARLQNLGYSETLGLDPSVRRFQRDYGLSVTGVTNDGEVPQPCRDKLQEIWVDRDCDAKV